MRKYSWLKESLPLYTTFQFVELDFQSAGSSFKLGDSTTTNFKKELSERKKKRAQERKGEEADRRKAEKVEEAIEREEDVRLGARFEEEDLLELERSRLQGTSLRDWEVTP